MKKFDIKKYLYKIVVVVLIVFFVGGVGIGAANILSIEGTRELYTPEEPLTPYPETDEQLVEYINSAIEKALEEKPLISMSESYSIDKDTITDSAGNAQLEAAAKKASKGIRDLAEKSLEPKTADYSESAAGFLGKIDISTADVESAEIDYEYYRCSMCTSNISLEDYGEECPECGNLNTLEKRSSDVYKITIRLKPDSVSVRNNAFPKNENIESILSEGSQGFYSLGKLDKTETGAVIYAEINRLTDKITCLRFETDFDMTADVDFSEAYRDIGRTGISASASDKYNYSFTWPGVSLNNHEMTVELGSTEVLKATLTCDNPVEYDVIWSSDNEDILTIDEEGYLKTHKKIGDATITAKLVFKDREYTDTCLVHVGVPCEGVDLSKGKLKMSSGDTFSLVAKFDPKDTTNTVCYWFTEDESVATIDDNGLVTAVGKGKTVVSVITDDGNYYSSCEVEVNS